MATHVTGDGPRTLLLFALKREAEPLVARLQPAWLEQYGTFAFLKSLPDPADVIEPSAEDVVFDFAGVGAKAARSTLKRLLAKFQQIELVIAAGYCGALMPGIPVGTVALPADVIDEQGGTWPCSGNLPGTRGRLLTASRLIGVPAEKLALGGRFGAEFVDMESAAIAEVCAARGLRFSAVRAVSDSCDTALSPRLVTLLSGGGVSFWKVMSALIRRPGMLKEFLRLNRDTKLAAGNLAEALAQIIGH